MIYSVYPQIILTPPLSQTDKEITGGNVLVNIQYLGYIPVLKETLDLCDLAASSGDSCPLAMGVHENYLEDKFPDFALSVRAEMC